MQDIYVSLKNINKSFSGVQILHDINLTVHAGEVLALLGGNGAGKSTLMKVLSGVHEKDSGEIRLYGNLIEGSFDTNKAKKNGISIVHQELNLCRHLTVAENIFLRREIGSFGRLNKKAMKEETRKLLESIGITDLDPDTLTGNLTIGRQQMVEIAKALYSQPKILIMDEPSSSLTEAETKILYKVIGELKEKGTAIIYITHRLQELKYIADTVLIMRDGYVVSEGPFSDYSTESIIRNMVGREIEEQYPRIEVPRGKEILSVTGLSIRRLRNASFSLYEGEVLGFTGLMGSGRSELLRTVFGVEPLEEGEIILDGKPVSIRTPKDAIENGILMVPQDRKEEGLCLNLSIFDNMVLPNLKELSNAFGKVDTKKAENLLQEKKEELTIKISNIENAASHMSGGNQQKLVIAKWLARHARVMIFDEPTRGIDVGARYEIYQTINRLKEKGIGVIVVSSELPEIMGISDRIIVMCEGRIIEELDPKTTSEEEIMRYATAFRDKILKEQQQYE